MERVKVRCGDFNLQSEEDDSFVQVREVASQKVHDDYSFPNFDIAVLKVKEVFEGSSHVVPICFEPTNSGKEDLIDSVIVVGWGLRRNF